MTNPAFFLNKPQPPLRTRITITNRFRSTVAKDDTASIVGLDKRPPTNDQRIASPNRPTINEVVP